MHYKFVIKKLICKRLNTIWKNAYFWSKRLQFNEYFVGQRAWQTDWQFKHEKAPDAKVIKNIINSFEKTGSVKDIPRIVRDPTQKRQEAKNKLETMVSDFPNLSIRKAASAVGVSPSLAHNILHDDLHLKPYKFHRWHKIDKKDFSKRVIFAEWFLSLPACTKDFFICTDEAYFYITLPVNKQNNRTWASEQPNEGVEYKLQLWKNLVWVGISASKVDGPYFFEGTVNQFNYVEMLKDFFWPKLLRTPAFEKYYFQQDGATPHRSDLAQEWLKDKFGRQFLDKTKRPLKVTRLESLWFFL